MLHILFLSPNQRKGCMCLMSEKQAHIVQVYENVKEAEIRVGNLNSFLKFFSCEIIKGTGTSWIQGRNIAPL